MAVYFPLRLVSIINCFLNRKNILRKIYTEDSMKINAQKKRKTLLFKGQLFSKYKHCLKHCKFR